MMQNAFLLRNLFDALNALAPGDVVMFAHYGTLSSGTLSIDLSSKVRKGAVVYCCPFVQYTTNTSTGVITAKDTADTTDTCLFAVIVNQNDLVSDGGD